MLFSVIIPVHNAEQYIDRCIQSIFANDFEDYEILAIENGSSDKSLAVLNSYAATHQQIKVYSTSEKGVSNARNIGLDNAIGDIITFVDIDDTVESNYFLEIKKVFYEFPDIDALVFNHKEIDKNKKITYGNIGKPREISGQELTEMLITAWGGSPWDKAIKRDKIKNIRFDKRIFIAEDLEFEVRLFYSMNLIRVSDIAIYNYWINPNSAWRTINVNETSMQLAINSSTENMLFSYQVISNYLCKMESSEGPIAQEALMMYADNLSTVIISAYIQRKKDKVEQYLPELNKAMQLSAVALHKKHPKKEIRIRIVLFLTKSNFFRPIASAFIWFNGCCRRIKDNINNLIQ